MEGWVYIVVFLLLLIIFFIQSSNIKSIKKKKTREIIEKNYAKRMDRIYKFDEYERIKKFHEYKKSINDDNFYIDDITWNDLSMDEIFKLMNNTYSSAGEEVLYSKLRTIKKDLNEAEYFYEISEKFKNSEEVSKKFQEIFCDLGRTKSISFFEFLQKITALKPRSNILNYISLGMVLLLIPAFIISPSTAVLLSVFVLSFNIFTYYKEKNSVKYYFVCIKYLIGLLDISKKIISTDIDFLNEENKKIEKITKELSYLKKGIFLIPEGGVNDSLAGMILEYVRFIFHLDLIKFNSILKKTSKSTAEIYELFEEIGNIEAAIALSSFKKMLENEYGFYSKAEISNSFENIEFSDIYHPMIKNAVKNSLSGKNILLTGSNASGKSTFLKTIGINGILSQTFNISTAKSFKMKNSYVLSSMSLKDNLLEHESYYMAEIRSLKRILDNVNNNDINTLCFIDEVLRGTNTVERISASLEILKALGSKKSTIFAATHDIELTKLLKNYENYHFEEEVFEKDVRFNYIIKNGPAITRNAIKLLEVSGYPEEIVTNALQRSLEFDRDGAWNYS